MLIYMSHPQHGKMPVYTESDAVYNEQFGWERENKQEVKQIVPRGEVETPEEAYEKKFGKPPHHKMKLETIIRKLEE